jgi:hypothetical protein
MLVRACAWAMLLSVAGVFACSRGETIVEPPPEVRIEPRANDAKRVVVTAVLPASVAAGMPAGSLGEERGRRWLRLTRRGASQPLVGVYRREGQQLAFAPRFALLPGVVYHAELRLGERSLTAVYQLPAEAVLASAPRVLAMYPTAVALPANHLRFYVRFSEAMQTGDSFWKQVELFDEQRAERVEVAWRELDIWSKDRTLVTMLLHPGRVKKGIPFAAELGPVLHAGRRYRLRIGAALKSAAGIALGTPHDKRFRVGPADRERPHPRAWRIESPTAGSKDALVLHFAEKMDHVTMIPAVMVRTLAGTPVTGAAVAGAEERSWRFSPQRAWPPEPHRIDVAPSIEDLAGNTPMRLFDGHIDEVHVAVAPKLTFSFTPRR